ncbi:MAG TPA: NAD-dependent epimerase/dehydratase family protein [Candidatus Limnocylindrales bacterium]|nr:NAD-dependent epimerase/dehydratase family protein [Candidatus Limnocylindrales bacterium]
MKILITGICGFVGQTLARALLEHIGGLELLGIDNLIRPGSEQNRRQLDPLGVKFFHTDIRSASDIDSLPAVDWVIDAAANASVLAGLEGSSAPRQLLEHNLGGTINLLEFCRRHRAGFLLLSTSRVYSVAPMAALEVTARENAFRPKPDQRWPLGASVDGFAENFSTKPPLSLYGSTKLASELLAQEYSAAFGFPAWINRCGVLAGAGQFGRADQGIFAYWIHSYARRRPLKYIGFNGQGCQVRDALHPVDLAPVLARQMKQPSTTMEAPLNFAGGPENSISLAQLSAWCATRFGLHRIEADPKPRPFDVPWLVLDCHAAAQRWQWKPQKNLAAILEEIATHAEKHPNWLDLTCP